MQLEKRDFRVKCEALRDDTVIVVYVKAVDCLEACHNVAELLVCIGIKIESVETYKTK